MFTDIHENIKEKMREAINNSTSIIADFMNYSLPYRIEDAEKATNKYAENTPWGKIAKEIKENPDILKSRDMAYAVSASFRSSTQIYALDEFSFALDIAEKLKVFKDDGVISEKQFQEVLALQSPETGETLLTKTMKDSLNLARGNSTIQMLNRLFAMGIDVNVPNMRGQYPIQIIRHYYNVRKQNIEYSIEKGLVSRDFINEDYTFPKEKQLVEERTSKETIEQIKSQQANKETPKIKYKKTKKQRAYITEGDKDVSTWREGGPQGYAYAVSVAETTYLTEDVWNIDTLILPGKYVVYEGLGEETQIIQVEKFYAKKYCLYLIDAQGKKLKAVDNREILKTLSDGMQEKPATNQDLSKIGNKVAQKVDEAINKNLDMNNIKTGLKQLEGASDKIFKKITSLLKK